MLPATPVTVEQKPSPPSAKQRRTQKITDTPNGKGTNGITEDKDIPVDYALVKRAARVVAEDSFKYTTDHARCPLPGCDSKGKKAVDKICG